MTRYIFGIMLFLMSLSFAAEQYLVYKSNTVSTVVLDIDDCNDNSDEESEPFKEKKGEYEQEYFFRSINSPVYIYTSIEQYSFNESFVSSGFSSMPYTPPDLM